MCVHQWKETFAQQYKNSFGIKIVDICIQNHLLYCSTNSQSIFPCLANHKYIKHADLSSLTAKTAINNMVALVNPMRLTTKNNRKNHILRPFILFFFYCIFFFFSFLFGNFPSFFRFVSILYKRP